jgi:hypothetical protein
LTSPLAIGESRMGEAIGRRLHGSSSEPSHQDATYSAVHGDIAQDPSKSQIPNPESRLFLHPSPRAPS